MTGNLLKNDRTSHMVHVNVTLNKFVSFDMGGGGVDRGTHCISVNRDMPIKGIILRVCLER